MDPLQPILTRNGVPIYFVLHNSIRNPGAIKALAEKIWAHGGDVLDDDEGADILLINPTRPGVDQRLIQSAYDCHPDQDKSKIWVREMSFVDECIQRGRFHLESPPRRPMPGMPPGRARIAFTAEDDENLCKHLARTLPEPASGGRQSLIFYEKLISLHKYLPDVYSWTKRHTSQSWREHYKKNKARLDLRIAEIVAEEGINPKAFHYKTRLLSPNEDLEMEEEAARLADDEEEAYEANYQDNAHRTSEKGKERAVESEDQLEEENQDADDVRVPKPKTKLQTHTRSERQRTRPSTSTPNSTNEPGPSQTLINIDPTSQPVRQDEDGGSKVNTPEGSESEDLQPFTFSFEQPMPSAGIRTNTPPASADPATVEDPPYHNTRSRARSRSASVNPAPAPAPSTKRAERKPTARKIAHSRPLSSLREASHEAEELLPEHEHEHLFPDVESHSDTTPNPVGGLQEATDVSDLRKRGRELEDEESEDDRQVRDLLENAGENESAPVQVVVETPPRHARGRPNKNSSVVPGKPRGRPKKKMPSVASESSSSSVVPVDGTRASTHKKKRTKEETYNSLFKPIPGTEAARQAERMTAA